MNLGKTIPVLRIFDEAKAKAFYALRIETDAVVEFQKQLLAKQYSYARPEVKETPWGSQDMSISDPFGNRLTFTDTMNA